MKNVFVPSKNRIKNAKLLFMAVEQDYPLNVVVEPQDFEAYKTAFPTLRIMSLPENNQGISYVRNWIKSFAKNAGLASYWQLDDDISALSYREGSKLIKDTIERVLTVAQQELEKEGAALGGLEYGQFAWCATKDFAVNSFCDVAVWVDVQKTSGIEYRPYFEGKEDRDFAMQVIKAGYKTMRFTLGAFNAPKNGSNAGGLKETFYDAGKEQQCADRMVEYWGENVCQRITKSDGRPDVKIKWDRITSTQSSLF